MPRLVTVWDTNIYRKVNQAVYAEIQSHEMQHGVIAFACYAVVMELLAHLATPQTPDGKAAMAALRRLCHHCTEFDGSYKIVRFVAPAQEQVPKLLFGDAPQFPNEADYYADLIGALTTNSGYLTTRHDQLAAICRAAEQAREKYVEMLWSTVVNALVIDAKSWADISRNTDLKEQVLSFARQGVGLPLLAAGIAREAASLIDRSLNDREEEAATAKLLTSFPLVVHYRNNVIVRLAERGPDMSKRGRQNGIFDLHVCCAISPIAVLRGQPVVLVTDDDEILDAAVSAQMRQRVLSLEDYRELLTGSNACFGTTVDHLRAGPSQP